MREKYSKKFKEVEDDATYSEEQGQLYITKPKKSLKASCKDQTDHRKGFQ